MKKTVKISHYLKHAAAVLFFIGMIMVGLYGSDVFATHTEQLKASGFAYGAIDDNSNGSADTGLGYVSFGCETNGGGACDATATANFPTGYGVRINANPDSDDYGKFFGHAWSSNYGWISFYHDDAAECGAGVQLSNIDTFIHTPGQTQLLSGYARVLNNDNSEWNGCISFSDNGGVQYGVKAESLSSGNIKLTGWAWGENLVGWLRFDCPECDVQFEAVDIGEEECEEADDPEECTDPEDLNSGLALYVGGQNDSPIQIIGNSSYNLGVTDVGQAQSVKLIPQAFDQDVDTCTATNSSSLGASVSGWNGVLSSLNPLAPDVLSNQFIATITNYDIGEVITFNLNCFTVVDDTPVSAEAFVTLQYPTSSVSIDANPNPIDTVLDPAGTTTLSWAFDNVQDNSCEINGVVDFTPSDGTDALTAMTSAFADDIGFNSWSPDNPGTDDLFGIVNFPVGFTITCLDYADQPLSDNVYITTTELGCTESMEAAGWCSNDINPIFEEF